MKLHESTLTPHEARRIAVEACVCERTVHRFFDGRAIRSTTQARIEYALKRLGLAVGVGERQAGATEA